MRTNDMIYQLAIAHQNDLRRTASERTLRADRKSGPSRWNRLLALITSRVRGSASTRPARSGVVSRRVSL